MGKSPCESCHFRCEDGVACCAGPMIGIPYSEPDNICSGCDDWHKCGTCEDLELPVGCFVEERLGEAIEHYERQHKDEPESKYFKAMLDSFKGYMATLKSARGVE